MNMHQQTVFEIAFGAALVAACSGKLAVDDTHGASNSSGGTGGADASGLGGGFPETGGSKSHPGGAGGFYTETGGTGGRATGGANTWETGGAAGCFSGTEPSNAGAGGQG